MTEEKTKIYDNALEKVRSFYKTFVTGESYNAKAIKESLEAIFPELKENKNNDENIIKEIISYLNSKVSVSEETELLYFKRWIAWLEIQDKQSNNEEAEKEKNDYVSGQFLYCKGSFNEFKEGTSYWLEYIGNDNYIGRSDNILNQKFHITPKQLYTWLDPRHDYRHRENCNDENNASREYGKSEDEKIRNCIGMCLTDANEQRFKDYNTSLKECLDWLKKQKEPEDKGEISDGYHTFNELYRYRMLYNAAFFNLLPRKCVHKSRKHNDGEPCFGGGWFIVMANLPTGQISNHYELKYWDLFQIPEREVADEWDGHTPEEAADRLYKYLSEIPQIPTNDYLEIEEYVKYVNSRLLFIEPNKYYYCINDFFSNGDKISSRGDVIMVTQDSPIIKLDIVSAGEYFLPVNKIE